MNSSYRDVFLIYLIFLALLAGASVFRTATFGVGLLWTLPSEQAVSLGHRVGAWVAGLMFTVATSLAMTPLGNFMGAGLGFALLLAPVLQALLLACVVRWSGGND